MKTLELLSVHEIEDYGELYKYLDLKDNEHFQDDYNTLFEGDPDMLKINSHFSLFMDILINDTLYIISSDDKSETFEILEKFFSSDFEKDFTLPEPNTWDCFHNSTNAIAYRGGSGYVYTIWQFTIKPILL